MVPVISTTGVQDGKTFDFFYMGFGGLKAFSFKLGFMHDGDEDIYVYVRIFTYYHTYDSVN